MFRILAGALVVVLPQVAQAQRVSVQGVTYCGGAINVLQFETALTANNTRANYRVELQNTQGTARRLQITVIGSVVDRPTAPVPLGSRTAQWVNMGYQTILSPGQAIRPHALEALLRISCV